MRRVSVALLTLALSASACAKFTPASCGGPDDTSANTELEWPATLGGLKVRQAATATKKLNQEASPEGSYQCPGGGKVYALRDGKELRAVLQVSRLAPDARLNEREFLSRLVRSVTGNVREPLKVEGVDVFQATSAGNSQLVTTWFQDQYMIILTVRESQTIAGQAVDVDFDQVLKDAVTVRPA